jgi:hypothetical protein
LADGLPGQYACQQPEERGTGLHRAGGVRRKNLSAARGEKIKVSVID